MVASAWFEQAVSSLWGWWDDPDYSNSHHSIEYPSATNIFLSLYIWSPWSSIRVPLRVPPHASFRLNEVSKDSAILWLFIPTIIVTGLPYFLRSICIWSFEALPAICIQAQISEGSPHFWQISEDIYVTSDEILLGSVLIYFVVEKFWSLSPGLNRRCSLYRRKCCRYTTEGWFRRSGSNWCLKGQNLLCLSILHYGGLMVALHGLAPRLRGPEPLMIATTLQGFFGAPCRFWSDDTRLEVSQDTISSMALICYAAKSFYI